MLNPEIAQARLKEFQVTDWLTNRLAKLVKLPPKLRSIGCGILAHDESGKQVKSDDSYKLIEDSVKNLSDLKAKD